MPYYWVNGGVTALATSLAASQTSATVSDAAALPSSVPYLLQLWDAGTYANPNNDAGMEIVKVTAVAGNTLTIERGQDGTSDQAHASGEYAANNLVAEGLEKYLWQNPLTTAENTIQPSTNAAPALTLKMASAQTADIFRIVSSSDAEIWAVGTSGDLTLRNQAAAMSPFTIVAAASQSATLTAWQNSSGTTLAEVTAAGQVKGATGQFGGSANYAAFAADGTLTWAGDGTTWEDLQVPGLSMRLAGSNDPTLTTFVGATKIYAFADEAVNEEEVYFTVQIPHAYKEGSSIYPHIHWAPEDGAGGNVRWALEYNWMNVTDQFTGSTTLTVDAAAGSTAKAHRLSSWSAITGTSKTISSILVCRLYRNSSHGNDTYTGKSAFLLQVDFHIERDAVGSKQELVK